MSVDDDDDAAQSAQSATAPSSSAVRRHRFVSPFLPRAAAASASASASTATAGAAALVVLNTPLRRPPSAVFDRLWSASSFRVCADGGANRLYDATITTTTAAAAAAATATATAAAEGNAENYYVPDLIKGDLDSLRRDAREHYESLGVEVERDPDQDTNDLDKALRAVRDRCIAASSSSSSEDRQRGFDVYVYGAFGGRFDQEMASVQALYRWSDAFDHRVFLYGDENCAFLLPPEIECEVRLPFFGDDDGDGDGDDGGGDDDENKADNDGGVLVGEGPTCGLIPVGGRCDSVRTAGLKWNLDGAAPLEFGGLVSTSNRVVEGGVTLKSSHPIVFTAEMTTIDPRRQE